ncbi:hypothetical protein [Pediococcus pentosaceus]|nr:hypothetical protein [Pediococcus pentosaceus]
MNPIINLQQTPAVKDDGKQVIRHSGFSYNCKGTSTFSIKCS